MKTKAQKEDITFKIENVDFCFKHVPGGTFLFGATPEQGNQAHSREFPIAEIEIDDFYLSETPITAAQYSLFAREVGQEQADKPLWDPYKWALDKNGEPNKGYEEHPMQIVTWYGALAYSKWLSEESELLEKNISARITLPTEQEFEYAAKYGSPFRFSGSDNLDEVGWYDENSNGKTQPVKQKKPNALGLYDMSGNVCKWQVSKLDGGSFVKNRAKNEKRRIFRGGSWNNILQNTRLSSRHDYPPYFRINNYGFCLSLRPLSL